ncbi:unnamed protein product [Medioppia subpectinata]|uniref:Peptidase S1 domain-containing protein n=1 Tax=Medioppia subpectinata TaxID=1979941 RepID=A0A7R9PW17_9ACAR|nr:unnamed protein product [Medioppia subpectinata]CAG2102845.1 unnamed protein product [Medioppia subpectinata]
MWKMGCNEWCNTEPTMDTNVCSHCGPNCTATDIRVYPGLRNQRYTNHTYYTGVQYFIHPNYESYQWTQFDLGLTRVDTDIPLDGTSSLTGINAICLPNKMAINKKSEYAHLVGHGVDNNTGLSLITIQKAYANNTIDRNYAIIGRRIPYNLGLDICTVDSGSPIVQYVNGVAVLIGVVVNALRDPHGDNSGSGLVSHPMDNQYYL